MIEALFHLVAGVAAGILATPLVFAAVSGWKLSTRATLARMLPPLILVPALHFTLALGLAVAGGWGGFGFLRLLAWGIFVHLPLLLAAGAWSAARVGAPRLGACSALIATALVGVGVDAFLIEPEWLEVTRHEVATAALDEPLRVVLVADLQTDAVGPFEVEVLTAVAALEPDLLLWAGDYVHLDAGPERARELERMNVLVRDLDLGGRLGSIAVGGNCDGWDWPAVFAGSRVQGLPRGGRVRLGPVTVDALAAEESLFLADPEHYRHGTLAPTDGYHIVLGHHPDFALADIDADLLLAGHCHGGQVRLPLLGPPLTLSSIPRRWTSGLHEIAPGRHLCVSRGIGMERSHAPRLRFLCRPELVVIDLVPSGS